MSTIDYSFDNWVKRCRKALDLTQQELDQRIGCSHSLIFKIESDERGPSRQVFWQALQMALNSGAIPVALYALVGIVTLHAKEGVAEPALELANYCWEHPARSWPTRERAERLRAALETQFTPHQYEIFRVRAQSKTFEALVQQMLDS
jgi:transcriptional regulator with XRE-family HTH domain